MFSFFLPKDEDYDTYTDFVVEKLTRMVRYAEEHGVVLLHENESGIYGNSARRCKVLFEKIPSANFRAVFDFSNFVACEQDVMEAYEMLKPYIEYIHVKDGIKGVGALPAGKGNGKVEEILRDLYKNGYDGYLSLEPHLFNYKIPEDASELVKSFETEDEQKYAVAYEALVDMLDKL
jgi:sugar phosphate isomerase/epimerase